jgi:perosamine synthetase
MKNIISVNELKFFGNEKFFLNRCIDEKWVSSDGPFISKFEKKFSSSVNRKYASTVCNGSIALEVAIAALKLKPKSEVIVPAFTIISCCNAIIKNNLKPVLVDCDVDTWNMNVDKLEKLITKKTRAIMIVHIYGLTVNVDPVIKLAKKYRLKIIEDAAEAYGQFYKKKPCGSFGDISTFSFYANKHLTTGEGGMILTNNKKYYERITKLKNLYFGKGLNRFVHHNIGSNFRMGSLQAALGLSQLENIKKIISIKKKLGEFYTNNLKQINSHVKLPLNKTEYCENNYWVYGLLIKKKSKFDNRQVIEHLKNKKIMCRPFFGTMNEQPIYKKMGLFSRDKMPNSSYLSKKGFYIPSGVGTTKAQMKKVIKELIFLFKKK